MASLFTELKRRNVFRVAIAYVVVCWVSLEVAEILIPIMKLPDWTLAMVLFVGIVGFPFTLVVAWAFELTPDGLKRAEDVAPGEASSGVTLNRIIIGLLSLAVIFLLANQLLFDSAQRETIEGGEAGLVVDEPKSIAVLPFVNMSNDTEQEYFSDGISEDLLVGLAHFDKLRVAARTSAFSFKGLNTDIKEIGEKLDVDTILEGSVRKSGNRLRITAQLINVADGYHLWSGTFDRELTDIFAIQDEISAAIINALRVHLSDEEALTETTAVDFEAYTLYLKGRESLRIRDNKSVALAMTQLQQATEIEPGYADAWAAWASASRLSAEYAYGVMDADEAHKLAHERAERALSLEPDHWQALAVKAYLLYLEGDIWTAIETMERAIASNPSEAILYTWRAGGLRRLGRFNEADASDVQAFRIDPLHFATRMNFAFREVSRGELARARELVTAGTRDALMLEAMIAGQEHRWADAVRFNMQGLEMPGYEQDTMLKRAFMETYFFRLKAADKAREFLPTPGWSIVIDVVLTPEATLPTMRQMAAASELHIVRYALVINLALLDRCEEILELKAVQEQLANPISGHPSAGFYSEMQQYLIAGWCLRQMERPDETRRLLQRLEAYIDEALINGMRPDYGTTAYIRLLLGDDEGAIELLDKAVTEHQLAWIDLEMPWMKRLEQREDFRAIKARLYDKINAERAKLGMAPVEP